MSVQPELCEIGEKIRLLRVQTEPTKTTCVSVNLLMPLGVHTAEYMVLASYLTHCTQKYPTLNLLNERLERLYGAALTCNTAKLGEGFLMRFQVTCLNDAYALDGECISEAVLDLLLDLLLCPYLQNGTFSAERVATEIRLCIEDLESEINDKRAYALRRMIETMCENEVYGIRTDDLLCDVRKITPEGLLAAWRQLLSQAVISVCAVGDIAFDTLTRSMQSRFSEIPRDPQPVETLFVESAEDVTELQEKMVINQSKLVLGFRSGMTSPTDGLFAMRIMTDLFGGGPYSQLFTHVRERLSLCYYCSARLERQKGLVVVQSGIEAENKQAALDEILRQWDIMKKGEFTDESLDASKAALTDAFRSVNDTPETLHNYYAQFIDAPICTPEAYIDGLSAVTREDVVAAANRLSLDTVYFLCGKEEA